MLADIYERVSASCQGLGLDTECLGGGRIDHNPSKKTIKVYDKSQVQEANILLLLLFLLLLLCNRVMDEQITLKPSAFSWRPIPTTLWM